jgi:hypothetical protein
MVTVTNRAQRLLESAQKIEPPFKLDETLCLYSPQDNADSLTHPRIADWLRFIRHNYVPQLPPAKRRVLLLMPCTKTKPYPFSSEHQHINQRLLESGFGPTQGIYLPQELQARLTPEFSRDVLNLSPLIDDHDTVLHRMVISEPMALVPYECIAEYEGKPSPATAYDDPGLFENRGNAVSPWRPDCTAVAVSATRWRWGDEERRHYVLMHNAMAEAMAATITRIADHYTEIVCWVAPGLTHRSFVLARGERAANNVRSFREVGAERLELIGANDHLPSDRQVECLPTLRQCREGVVRLAKRLRITTARAKGVYARGGANATPLTLPELLDVLVARVTGTVESAKSSRVARRPAPDARTSPKQKVANALHSLEDRRQRQRPHAALGRSAGHDRRR